MTVSSLQALRNALNRVSAPRAPAPIRFGSVCSGIEAASVAWEPLGWAAAWVSEIEAFPSAVLAHHWPEVPNLGDMLALPDRVASGEIEAPDVLVGGTPCQAFSLAGRRESLSDARGGLTLAYVELANEIDEQRRGAGKPEAIIVWENVPGVLNTHDNAFGCFLGALAGEDVPLDPPGGRWSNAGAVFGPKRAIAWRIIDAQYFGVAQRRRRVFVVASARAGFDPCEVLFERDGVRRDSAPSRETGQGFTHDVAPSLTSSGRGVERAGETRGQDPVIATRRDQTYQDVSLCLNAGGMGRIDYESESMVVSVTGDITHTLNTANNGKGSSEDGTGRGTPIIAFSAKDYGGDAQENLSPTLRAGGHSGSHANAGVMPAVAFDDRRGRSGDLGSRPELANTLHAAKGQSEQQCVAHTVALRGRAGGATAELGGEVATALRASSGGGDKPHVMAALAVRRLTPAECEKLQGFLPGHTLVPYRNKSAVDGPRYKAIGNSMAVPVMRWIGRRIEEQING